MKALKASQTEITNLTNYFKSILNIYKDTNNKTISRLAFASFYTLPLFLSDRIFYCILDVNRVSNLSTQRHIVEKLVAFYLGDSSYQRARIMIFLDSNSNGYVSKADIELLAIHFISFLRYSNCEREKILKLIGDSFVKCDKIVYDLDNIYQHSQLNYIINLFHHFLIQAAPVEEFTNYMSLSSRHNFEETKRSGLMSSKNLTNPLRCNSVQFPSLRHSSISSCRNDWTEEAFEYELCFREAESDSLKNASSVSEYNHLSFKDSYTLSNGVKKKLTGDIVSRKYKKPSMPQRNLSVDTSSTADDNSDTSIHRDSYGSGYNINSTPMREYLFLCKEGADSLKKYKFLMTERYIYYSCNKKRFELIPIATSYTEDIRETHIQQRKYYKLTVMAIYPLERVKVTLYSLSKEDLIRFKKEHKQLSDYKSINDYYELGKEIGRGKFAVVYSGVDKGNQSQVAIKCINKKTLSSDLQREMVQKEYDIFRFLLNNPHAHIVKGIEYFESDDFIYFVYEYLPKQITSDDSDHLEKTRKYLRQIASAILFLHSHGIIHRDIKPENILIDENDNVKLIDLGLGTIRAPSEMMTNQCGTLISVAPEILEAVPYGDKCDVWSLGVVAYYLEYGSYPFEGSSTQEITEKISKGDYRIPTSLSKDRSQLDVLIKRCLVVENDLRIDVTEIISMLL